MQYERSAAATAGGAEQMARDYQPVTTSQQQQQPLSGGCFPCWELTAGTIDTLVLPPPPEFTHQEAVLTAVHRLTS